MKTKIITITPEWADKVLLKTENAIAEGKFNQRNVSLPTVKRLAQDIRNGDWVTTHQGIALDNNGYVVDGRHRLYAIKNAGIPVDVMVTFDIPTEVIDATDRGRVRGIGQQLTLSHRLPNGTRWAAVARAIAIFALESEVTLTTAQTLAIIDKVYFKNIQAVFGATERVVQQVAWICAPIVIFHGIDSCAALDFATKLFTLENLPQRSPVLIFDRWYRAHGNRSGNQRLACMKVAASAIYHFAQKNDISKIYSNNDAYLWLQGQDKTRMKRVREIIGA